MDERVAEFRGRAELSGEGFHTVVPVFYVLELAPDADERFVEEAGRVLLNQILDGYTAMAEGRPDDIQNYTWN